MKNLSNALKGILAIFLILVLSSMPILMKAQEKNEKPDQFDWVVKFNIYGSIAGDMVTNSSGMAFGVEKNLNNHLSFQQFFTYIFRNNALKGEIGVVSVEKINGIRSGSQLRYYIQKDKPDLIGVYIGPELMYQYTRAKRNQSHYVNGPNGYVISNDYYVNRNQFNLHFVIGYQGRIFKKLLIENSIGLGLRFVTSNSVDKIDSGGSENEFLYSKEYDTGDKIFPSVNFKLCLGWSIQ
ncbi:MAG: hypothetical protein K9G58_09210 [Bacteroidales bacterium]|nr:hypothetical protein [Bacteroidales bacterium]MCF8398334.1 hypothetical protein [Bacteroidales bacterium]